MERYSVDINRDSPSDFTESILNNTRKDLAQNSDKNIYFLLNPLLVHLGFIRAVFYSKNLLHGNAYRLKIIPW